MAAKASLEASHCEHWSDIPEGRRFQALASEAGSYATKFLKRLRAEGHSFRYLMATEKHKDGFPHFHLLVHERLAEPITKRRLEAQWRAGFSHWRLVDAADVRGVSYVVKYIGKSNETRVRASARYGQAGAASLLTERVSSLAPFLGVT